MFLLKPLISLLFLCASVAEAGTLLVPRGPTEKRPALDLVKDGRVLDIAEASSLARQGFPLDRLDPNESTLWTSGSPDRIAPEVADYPAEGSTLVYDSPLGTTRGWFRVAVDQIGPDGRPKPFALTITLNYASAVVRASLLRRMGYMVVNPKVYRRLKIRFASVDARNEFLDAVADRSLTSRDRWVVSAPENEPVVTLRQAVLEPGRATVQTLHWGSFRQELQRDRRVFRALLVPYILAEIPEKVNQYAWDVGRIFNDGVWLEYIHSDGFPDVTYADLKWAVRKIAALSREEIAASVADAGFPRDVAALVTERMISRRNGFISLFGLNREFSPLPVNARISVGDVSGGQLQRDDCEDCALDFYEDPSRAPLRFSQMWRYFLVQGISAGLGEGLSQMNNRLLSVQTQADAVARHNRDVQDGVARYLFRTDNGGEGYTQTTGLWGAPILGMNVNASRSVIAGTIMGSDSQVQLVDTISADVNAGYFLGFDQIPSVLPGLSTTVKLGRSYSHVRPISDVRDGLRTNWGRIAVTAFMAKLGSTLNPDIECTIPETAHQAEFQIDGETYYKVKYDKDRETGLAEAQELRRQMARDGIPEARIILEPIDRQANCGLEVDEAVKENLEGFLEELAVGESFVVTDYIKFGMEASLGYALPVWKVLGLSVSGDVGEELQFARATIIRKTEDGIQISLQDRRVNDVNFGFDLSFYLKVFSYQRTRRHGVGTTDFYPIRTTDISTAERKNVIRAVRGLLLGNSAEILTDHFHPYTLTHDVRTRINRFKFLAWSRDVQRQEHEADIYPPYDPQGRYDREAMKRTIYMRRNVTRNGSSFFGLLTEAIGGVAGEAASSALGGVGSSDPGNSIGGESSMRAVSVQGEVTPNRESNPIAVVEETHRGWRIRKRVLFETMDRIEASYLPLGTDNGSFHREIFSNTNSLQLYQLETSLLFYPESLEELSQLVLSPERSHREVFTWLAELHGWNKLNFYCAVQATRRTPMINIWYRDPSGRVCSPPWIEIVMRLRRQGLSSDPRERIGQLQTLAQTILKNVGAAKLLKELNDRYYFLMTRVSGYRSGDVNGSIDFISDTIGKFDNTLGLGIYRDISSDTGISAFEIYGRFFTDGL